MEEITITITLTKSCVSMRHNDCAVDDTSENGTKVSLGGTKYGGYEITVGGNTYYATVSTIWNAVAPIFGLEKAENWHE